MPSMSFFKKRQSRDSRVTWKQPDQDNNPVHETYEGLPGLGEWRPLSPTNLRSPTAESSILGTGSSDYHNGTWTSPSSPEPRAEQEHGRSVRHSSTRHLIRGFLGHTSRGSRSEGGATSPSRMTSRTATSTPFSHLDEGVGETAAETSRVTVSPPAGSIDHHMQNRGLTSPTVPKSSGGDGGNSNSSSHPPSLWKSQRLRRLQSLTLKPRLKKDKVKAPQVIVTPATVVSKSFPLTRSSQNTLNSPPGLSRSSRVSPDSTFTPDS